MTDRIELPRPLRLQLKGSALEAPIRLLADPVGEIVTDNKLPFFPDYTDHGAEHLDRVLHSAAE
jgi:molecular chaperone HtpG